MAAIFAWEYTLYIDEIRERSDLTRKEWGDRQCREILAHAPIVGDTLFI